MNVIVIERYTLIPQWAPAEREGSPKRLPTGTKKVPYIETKVAKRPPHSEKVAKRPPIIAKKIFQGRRRPPTLAPPP